MVRTLGAAGRQSILEPGSAAEQVLRQGRRSAAVVSENVSRVEDRAQRALASSPIFALRDLKVEREGEILWIHARQFFLSQTAGTRGDSRACRRIAGSQFNRCRLTRCVSTEWRLQAIPEEGVSSHRNPPIPLSSQAPTRWRFWSSCWRVAASTRSTLKSRMQR